MAKLEVTNTYRNSDGDISALFVRGQGKMSIEEVINRIKIGEDRYYVKDPLTPLVNEVEVTVVCGEHGEYLRTTPDESILNNLEALSDC